MKDYFGLPEWVRIIGFSVMLILLLSDFFVPHRSYVDAFNFPGSYGFIGLIGGLTLIVMAKVFDVFVRRDEGYYDDE